MYKVHVILLNLQETCIAGVYTEVAYFLDWIQSTIQEYERRM